MNFGSYALLLLMVLLILPGLAACTETSQAIPSVTPTYTVEEAEGKRIFELHCASCHSTIPDSIVVGPSLAGVSQRAAKRIEGMDGREYIELSIEQPGDYIVEGYKDLMPVTIADALSEEEMDAILAYLMTLDE